MPDTKCDQCVEIERVLLQWWDVDSTYYQYTKRNPMHWKTPSYKRKRVSSLRSCLSFSLICWAALWRNSFLVVQRLTSFEILRQRIRCKRMSGHWTRTMRLSTMSSVKEILFVNTLPSLNTLLIPLIYLRAISSYFHKTSWRLKGPIIQRWKREKRKWRSCCEAFRRAIYKNVLKEGTFAEVFPLNGVLRLIFYM